MEHGQPEYRGVFSYVSRLLTHIFSEEMRVSDQVIQSFKYTAGFPSSDCCLLISGPASVLRHYRGRKGAGFFVLGLTSMLSRRW